VDPSSRVIPRRQQPQAPVSSAMRFALKVYSFAFQPLAEALLRADLLAGAGCPLRPGAKQCCRFFPRVRITLAAFFNPGRNSVLGFQILCRCLRNG